MTELSWTSNSIGELYLTGRIRYLIPWVGKTLPGWEPRIDVLEALTDYAHMNRVAAGIRGVHIE